MMGVVNKQPSLKQMLVDLEKRIASIERSRRFTVPVLQDWTQYPLTPQSGDIVQDAETGFLFVYCIDGNTVPTGTVTVSAGAATVAVSQLRGFKPYQSVAVITAGTDYYAVVQAGFTPTVGAGSLPLTFLALTVSTPAGFSATVPADGTLAVTNLKAASWRQLITSSDLIAKQTQIGLGTLGTASFSGQNSAVGALTGGTGEMLSVNGFPPYQAI
jgi:hypothetical protein